MRRIDGLRIIATWSLRLSIASDARDGKNVRSSRCGIDTGSPTIGSRSGWPSAVRGKDGAVSQPVSFPCGHRGDLLGPRPSDRGQASSGPRSARRAIRRGAQGAGAQSPPGNGRLAPGKWGTTRSQQGIFPRSRWNRVRSREIHAPGSLGRQPTGFVPGSRPTLGGNGNVTFCGAIKYESQCDTVFMKRST